MCQGKHVKGDCRYTPQKYACLPHASVLTRASLRNGKPLHLTRVRKVELVAQDRLEIEHLLAFLMLECIV